MKIQVTAVIAFAIASGTHAQQAVQWKVSDGGNGHWYLLKGPVTGIAAEALADASGGHLATLTSSQENVFAKNYFGLQYSTGRAIIGLLQQESQSSPSVGWYWVTGEPFDYTNWTTISVAPFTAPDDRP